MQSQPIVIINYGMGNLGSIANMLARLGVESQISSDPEEILRGKKFILPGVGAFAEGMKEIEKSNLRSALEVKVLEEKCPILGICLGFQLFSKRSDEGNCPGLGWIDGEVLHFSKLVENSNWKVPHMGWNIVQPKRENPLFSKDENKNWRFYFVHSYFFRCTEPNDVLAETSYSSSFHSAIHRDNIYGVQFHPEKSHKFGMRLLKNFAEI